MKKKTVMTLLLKSEPCYLRYDYDPKNENGKKHPLFHLDVNFFKYGNWKIGLHDMITPYRFCQIFNKENDCEFFENENLAKKDKSLALTQLMQLLFMNKNKP